MKHLALIQLQFAKLANLRDDILNAQHSSRKSVFLGGKTDPSDPWREQVKDSLGDKFVFMDPYDDNWDPKDNIYDECNGLLKADHIVFYKGGEQSKKEKDFLDQFEKDYYTTDNLDHIIRYLKNIRSSLSKRARLFEELTKQQQSRYLLDHPSSKKILSQIGNNIADKLKVRFDGYWPDLKSFAFSDPLTESSFTAKNFEHAEFKLDRMRKLFEEKKHAKTIQANYMDYLKKIAAKELKLSKGTIIKVDGLPFELNSDVPVIGTKENMNLVKNASEWEDLSYKQQKQYLHDHPKSKKNVSEHSQRDTKDNFLTGMKSWVDHEKYHKKLAIVLTNFMHKYLPEKFRVTLFDEDTGNVPDYDTIVNKYGLTKYLDEQSGDDIQSDLAVIDEQTENTVRRFQGGEFLRLKVATGIYEGKRMIVVDSERYGLAPVKKDGVEIRKHPYASHGVQIIVAK